MGDSRDILVVARHSPDRIERHYGPLAAVSDRTTMICTTPNWSLSDIDYIPAPTAAGRLGAIVAMFFLAMREARRDYDAVVATSLFPYGLIALAVKAVSGTPAHLGILGIDIDHHAQQWYGPIPRWLFRRFDTLSVPGPSHVDKLAATGVPRERIFTLANAIDTEVYRPEVRGESVYDFLWVGRFGTEKDPLTFVRALAMLDDLGVEFRAVMLGDGGLDDDVRSAIAEHGLDEAVDLPGWVDEPVRFYRMSRIVAFTSRRDALPLGLLEAMATGVAPVAPRVGSIPDAIDHGENGLLLPERSAAAVALSLLAADDEQRRRRFAERAAATAHESFSYEQAREDWDGILDSLVGPSGESRAIARAA